MKSLFFAVLLTCFCSHSSHAEVQQEQQGTEIESQLEQIYTDAELSSDEDLTITEYTPIETNQIRILGRGLQSKKTGNAIAIGCVDENCSKIQHVFLDKKTLQAHFFGKTYALSTQQDLSQNSKVTLVIRSINQEFKKFRKEDPARAERTLAVLGLEMVALGVVFAVAPEVLLSSPYATLAVTTAIFGPGTHILLSSKVYNPDHGIITSVMVNQNGWSWTERPTRIRNNAFEKYQRFVESTYH